MQARPGDRVKGSRRKAEPLTPSCALAGVIQSMTPTLGCISDTFCCVILYNGTLE